MQRDKCVENKMCGVGGEVIMLYERCTLQS